MKEFYLSKQEAFDAIAEHRAKAEERKHETTMRELEQLNALEILTVRQAAALLQVSSDKIYDLCNSGELPSQKVGRVIRIKRSDLDRVSVEEGW